MPRIKQTAHRAAPSQSEIEEEDDDFLAEEEGVDIDQAEASGVRKRKKKRTRAEMAEDKRKEWENSFNTRKYINERQIDLSKFRTEHLGVRLIVQKGLHFWTEQLLGYNKSIVVDFYKYMKLPEGNWENDPNVKIVSRVGNFVVEISPDDIASYLKIQRPPPESVNYPRKDEMIDVQVVNNALYDDPSEATDPHVPGNFKRSVRFLNKAIHYNLYPRGSEHRPTRKSAELLYVFLDNDLVVDWAMFIFTQLRDFKANTLISANMPFPCMITSLCKAKGVSGWGYDNLEKLSPGVFDETFDEKSMSQTPARRKDKQLRGEYLTTMPKKKEKQTSWIKKLFCQGIATINSRRKEKVERRMMMREQERLKKEVAWQTQFIEQNHGVKYVPEPEAELGEISDDYAGYESEEQED